MNVPRHAIRAKPKATVETGIQPGLFRSTSGKSHKNRQFTCRGSDATLPVMVSVQTADPEPVKIVRDQIPPPRLKNGTLFIAANTPSSQWKSKIDDRHFDEVYVTVSPDDSENDIAFARTVLMYIRSHFHLADPVVIGPVSPEIASNWQSEIEKAGLSVTEFDPHEYTRELASVRRRASIRRSTHRRR
jgi:hypothetical protein